MSNVEARIAYRIPPDPHLCRDVREGVNDLARHFAIDEETLAHFQTALGEAMANAIEHGGSTEPIEIEVRLEDEQLVAVVRDRGRGFDSEGVQARTSDLAAMLSERGRGLPIMRRCSDLFTVASAPGDGTVVTIGRRLHLRRGAA